MKTPPAATIDVASPPRSLLRLLAEFIVDDYLKEKEAANADTFAASEVPPQTNEKQE